MKKEKNIKQRLFEMMNKIDPTFKKTMNEGYEFDKDYSNRINEVLKKYDNVKFKAYSIEPYELRSDWKVQRSGSFDFNAISRLKTGVDINHINIHLDLYSLDQQKTFCLFYLTNGEEPYDSFWFDNGRVYVIPDDYYRLLITDFLNQAINYTRMNQSVIDKILNGISNNIFSESDFKQKYPDKSKEIFNYLNNPS